MLKLFRTIVLLIVMGVFACHSTKSSKENADKWSARMANTVIGRYDSLINYLDRKNLKWQYDIAFVGQAIDKLGNVDPKYSKYMEDYINFFVQEDGTVKNYRIEEYNIDRINPAKNIITLYKRTGEKKYRDAIELHVKQMENHPKTESGGFWHKKIYPSQIWLDGVYMATPFLAQYAKEFNAPQWFDVVAHEIILVYEKTRDEETGLLYHAWDESIQQKWADKETGRSPHFWSRAMGWYMMAIVDVLDFMPKDHPDRDEIINIFNQTAEALVNVRDPETGLWFQVLDRVGVEGNYAEGSGSAMFTYAFAKGAKQGYLNEKYLTIANEAFDSILEHLIVADADGYITMTHICGACGLGGNPYRDGSYEYYVSEKQVNNDPKGVASFIMAALELDR